MNRRRLGLLLLDMVLTIAVFEISHRIYRSSTGLPQLCDSTYSLLAAEKILTTGSANLREHISADVEVRKQMHGYTPSSDLPYQFITHAAPQASQAAIYYGYPLGSTFLSMPLLKYYLAKRGMTVVREDGQPNLEAEALLQQRIASRVSAATTALFYVVARFFCPPLLAAVLALGFGLGSPVWSTLSRSLWSHTWMVFWLTAAIALLVWSNRRDVKTWASSIPLGIGLGTALFAIAVTRPHGVLSAGPIVLYLLLRDRRMALATILTGGIWMTGYVVASYSVFGVPTPPSVYEPDPIDGHDVLRRLGWLMFSPSRGLLLYCPYLVVLGGWLVVYRKSLRDVGLLIPAALSCGAYVAVFSMYNGWHAGSSYGPRYFSDLIPWFVLVGAMSLDSLRRADTSCMRKGIEATILAATFAWAIWVHGRGANSPEAWEWNYLSITMGPEEAARDWRYPQFLAGITFAAKPDGSVVALK